MTMNLYAKEILLHYELTHPPSSRPGYDVDNMTKLTAQQVHWVDINSTLKAWNDMTPLHNLHFLSTKSTKMAYEHLDDRAKCNWLYCHNYSIIQCQRIRLDTQNFFSAQVLIKIRKYKPLHLSCTATDVLQWSRKHMAHSRCIRNTIISNKDCATELKNQILTPSHNTIIRIVDSSTNPNYT